MHISFAPIQLPQEQEQLIAFLTSEEWPFHVNNRLSSEKVLEMIGEEIFTGSNHEAFWILGENKQQVGFIRIFDLDDVDDGYPLFDLRIRAAYRGKGIGKLAVQWLTKYLFDKHQNLGKIVGTTRADNMGMRKTFRTCGYVKEGHYRKDWSAGNGVYVDTVKYAILREDWQTGTSTPVLWNDEV